MADAAVLVFKTVQMVLYKECISQLNASTIPQKYEERKLVECIKKDLTLHIFQ